MSATDGSPEVTNSGGRRCLFLARGEPTQYGYSWPDRGVDGPHDAPEGVAKAAKLYDRIFGDKGPWVMVEVHPGPDIDVPINEAEAEADADLLRYAVAHSRGLPNPPSPASREGK